MIMLCIFKENIQTWMKAIEIAGSDQKKLQNVNNESN